jgi:hypothetical protein
MAERWAQHAPLAQLQCFIIIAQSSLNCFCFVRVLPPLHYYYHDRFASSYQRARAHRLTTTTRASEDKGEALIQKPSALEKTQHFHPKLTERPIDWFNL